MLRIISALTLILGLTVASPGAMAQASDKPALAADAPDRHIVVEGDTLWGIAGKFLKDPWRWPELWRMNKEQVKNPHRIFPGDILVLDRVAGKLSVAKPVKLEPKVYSSKQHLEISSIPPRDIDPFLSQPLIIEADALSSAPVVAGTQEGRVMVGTGDKVFVRGIADAKRREWSVYRPGAALKDPVSGEVLGHEAFYLGTARLEATGDMAMMTVTTAKQEIGPGDRLVPTERPPLVAYAPRKPDAKISARILGIYGAVTGGQYNIVTINQGRKNGLEIGHVLAISRSGRSQEKLGLDGVKETVVYPDERYGLMFVFRVFDRVAYALVMQSTRPLAIGDAVGNP